MARRAVIEAVILTNAWKTSLNRKSFSLFLTQQKFQTPISNSRCGCRIITNFKNFCSGRRTDHQLNCSNDENLLSSPSSFTENHREPPQEADRKAISEVSKSKGRVGQTTNMVFGDTVIDGSTGEWLTLNQKVNTYPTLRRFTAIGIGGDDFVQAMVVAVESVIQCPIPQGDVKQRLSSGGKYVSVNIGPVRVVSSEQVLIIVTYDNMHSSLVLKRDDL